MYAHLYDIYSILKTDILSYPLSAALVKFLPLLLGFFFYFLFTSKIFFSSLSQHLMKSDNVIELVNNVPPSTISYSDSCPYLSEDTSQT